MEKYTDEFTLDKKIAEAVYNRYFRTFRNLKDDLIQIALIEMWRFRTNTLKRYTKSCISKVAHDTMANYIKRECKFLDTKAISIFDPIVDGLFVQDTIKGAYDYEPDKIESYWLLQRQVADVLDTFNDKGKKIIRMYLNRRSYFEIAKCFGVTKPCVHKYVTRFRDAVSQKMGVAS